MDVEKVKQFPLQYNIMTTEWFMATPLIAIVLLVAAVSLIVVVVALLFVKRDGKANNWLATFGIFCSIFLIITPLVSKEVFKEDTKERQLDYLAGYYEWDENYLKHYMSDLPVQAIENIQKVEKDFDKQVREGNLSENKGKTPIKITTDSGQTYEMWAEIKPNDSQNKEKATFKELKEDLYFTTEKQAKLNFPDVEKWGNSKGFYGATLYTDKLKN